MAARTTYWNNAIERLGVPLFCWGQNSAQGYLQTALPSTGGGITTFPRAPGMAATCASPTPSAIVCGSSNQLRLAQGT